MQRLITLGGTVVTRSGAPVTAGRTNKLRAVVMRAPDGHLVELLQPETLSPGVPPAGVSSRGAPPAGASPAGVPPAGAIDARVRLTVDNLDRAVELYRGVLGFEQVSRSEFTNDRTGMDLLGLPESGEYRYASLQVPGSKLSIELIEFRGIDRQRMAGRIQDPGSTRLLLQVRDVDAAVRAVVDAGGAVVSTDGAPVELPAGGGAMLRSAMVRDPDNLFLVFSGR
jgi:catechol 2,3-dioxygenase-like lactoylglutathione lyase family enzyme